MDIQELNSIFAFVAGAATAGTVSAFVGFYVVGRIKTKHAAVVKERDALKALDNSHIDDPLTYVSETYYHVVNSVLYLGEDFDYTRYNQRIGVKGETFDLRDVYNDTIGRKCLHYLVKASKLCPEGDANVFKYLQQALEEDGSLSKERREKIYAETFRKWQIYFSGGYNPDLNINNGLSNMLPPEHQVFPMLAMEKGAKMEQLRVLPIYRYKGEFYPKVPPKENIRNRNEVGEFVSDPNHPHLMRGETLNSFIEDLNSDPELAHNLCVDYWPPGTKPVMSQDLSL